MRFLSFVFLLLIATAGMESPQDSPVTSTDFHQAYLDVPLVKRASMTHTLDNDMNKFLLSKKTPIDQKAALVNALGWDQNGTPNFDAFATTIQAKRKVAVLSAESKLKSDDLLVLGYLLLIEDYFHPANALPYLERAASELPQSQTAQMLLALCKAQISFDSDWCAVWTRYKEVAENASLTKDLRPEALSIIREYMVLYKEECK
ncbi:MAG: hypothetical protein NWR72_21710 [Bacteroidia bacterium]|nr:hypothetical protein [Bacteroidia bacterium]